MYKKNIFIYIALVYFTVSKVNAQDYFSFYNLEDYVVQTQNVSPVFIPKNSFTFAVPVVNVGLNFNSGFKVNQLLVQDETTQNLRFDLDNLYATSAEDNDLNIDLSVNLFFMAFKMNKGSFTVFANTKATNNLRYTKDFLNVAANGITSSFVLSEQNKFTGYNEIGIGITRTFLKDRLAIAVRAKYLNGFAHTSTEDDAQISLDIDENTAAYTIRASNATVNTAGINYDDGEDFSIFTGNTGFGFDFGATFKATKKLIFEIAVNDVGSINWKENVTNYNVIDTDADGILYEGIDLREPDTENEFNNIVDMDETNESFTSNLNMKTYLSARYKLTDRNMFTLAAFNNHAFGDIKPSYSLGYNRTLNKTTFGVLASMGGVENDLRFGANFTVNLGPLQLYGATDSLAAVFTKPEESTGLNARLGLNFVFGYKKWIKKAKQEEELMEE